MSSEILNTLLIRSSFVHWCRLGVYPGQGIALQWEAPVCCRVSRCGWTSTTWRMVKSPLCRPWPMPWRGQLWSSCASVRATRTALTAEQVTPKQPLPCLSFDGHFSIYAAVHVSTHHCRFHPPFHLFVSFLIFFLSSFPPPPPPLLFPLLSSFLFLCIANYYLSLSVCLSIPLMLLSLWTIPENIHKGGNIGSQNQKWAWAQYWFIVIMSSVMRSVFVEPTENFSHEIESNVWLCRNGSPTSLLIPWPTVT